MMGKTYTAANGQVVMDEMIDAWCESYERGEFPDGEHTVGGIVHGRPRSQVRGRQRCRSRFLWE